MKSTRDVDVEDWMVTTGGLIIILSLAAGDAAFELSRQRAKRRKSEIKFPLDGPTSGLSEGDPRSAGIIRGEPGGRQGEITACRRVC